MLWSSRQNSVKLVEYTVRVSWELENFLVVWKNTHQAAIMLHHRMGGSNNRNLFSYSLEGWKFKIRVLTVLVSLEASLLDSEMPASSCVLIQPSPCMHVLLLAILGLKFLLIRPSVRTSLVLQWIGIHLPMQGTWVLSLVQEDFTYDRAVKPTCPNHRSLHALGPVSHN